MNSICVRHMSSAIARFDNMSMARDLYRQSLEDRPRLRSRLGAARKMLPLPGEVRPGGTQTMAN